MNFFKENSHLSEEAIALYVDALKLEVLDKVPGVIRDHVSECAACKIEIEELFLLLEDEKYDREKPHPFFSPPASPVKKILPWIFRIAAVFLVVLGSYGVYQLYLQKPDRNAGNSASPNISKATAPVDTAAEVGRLLTDSFAELPSIEDLVKTEYRSGTIEVQSPGPNAEVGDRVTFRWTHAPVNHVTLKILNNAGKEIHSVRTDRDSCVFSGILKPGLYYWKLESDDELLFVGKIRKK